MNSISDDLNEQLSSQWTSSFRRRLRRWYARHARDLPWRRTSDPYAIWVSEVMLQQTQVETVKSYFDRFLSALPTIQALAAAPQDRVMRLWEGLGYYRRAKQLHAAAQQIVAEHGGAFPRHAETACRLPGVGRYTAGAVLSIAFDQREPIVEANTVRLFSRLVGYRGPTDRSEGQRLLWSVAERLLPRSNCGQFNQALMELGSEVCQVRNPHCESCPVAKLCAARQNNWQDEIPRVAAKPRLIDVNEVAVVVRHRRSVFLRQCQEGERWAGLWDFPRFEVESDEGAKLRREIVRALAPQTGFEVVLGEQFSTIKHGVTRYRITLRCFFASVATDGGQPRGHGRWIPLRRLNEYALNSSGRRIATLVS